MAALVAQEAADKSVYIQAADDPLGTLFLAGVLIVGPLLAGLGIHYGARGFNMAVSSTALAVIIVVAWWIFVALFVDIQTGVLVE